MTDNAVPIQLPIMVRRPRAVWPGLDRMDLHRKQIAGDGNCLFASLADQLYGNPEKHLEIRKAIIDHMRSYRPLFEAFAIKDDIQQKRTTRAAKNAIKNNASEDNFEGYLSIMSKAGSYGGEPELQAFVQCYDRDVLVHLPRMEGYPEAIPYINQHRSSEAIVKPQLHLCYGGDEITSPHYDSARRNTPEPQSVDTSKRISSIAPHTTDTHVSVRAMTPRAIRNNRSELSRDLMHDMIVKGSKEFKSSFDDTDRARSPSVTSSHYSSSSKRSFDDDGDSQQANKRADRRKSTRIAGSLNPHSTSRPRRLKLKMSTHSQPATPQSTQSSDYSSDQSDQGTDAGLKSPQEPDSSSASSQEATIMMSLGDRTRTVLRPKASTESVPSVLVPERQAQELQT